MSTRLLPNRDSCLCGCGQRPKSGSYFVSGHDAKVASRAIACLEKAIAEGDRSEAYRHFTALQALDYWFFGSSVWSPGRVWLEDNGYPLDRGYRQVSTSIELSTRRFMGDYVDEMMNGG